LVSQVNVTGALYTCRPDLVDYANVFESLERALAIYGTGSGTRGR